MLSCCPTGSLTWMIVLTASLILFLGGLELLRLVIRASSHRSHHPTHRCHLRLDGCSSRRRARLRRQRHGHGRTTQGFGLSPGRHSVTSADGNPTSARIAGIASSHGVSPTPTLNNRVAGRGTGSRSPAGLPGSALGLSKGAILGSGADALDCKSQ